MGILACHANYTPNELGHNMFSPKGPGKPISMPDHLIVKNGRKPPQTHIFRFRYFCQFQVILLAFIFSKRYYRLRLKKKLFKLCTFKRKKIA